MSTIEDAAYNYANTKCRCSLCCNYHHTGMRSCKKSEGETCLWFRSLREGFAYEIVGQVFKYSK